MREICFSPSDKWEKYFLDRLDKKGIKKFYLSNNSSRSKKEYLEKLGLIFLGFEDQLVKEKFKEIYSNKIDLYNLDKWEEYEKSNPRIFAGMYQFWCKKI